MGLDIFGRIKDILAANVDELLSRAEDPELMADQMVRRYEDAMKELLNSTAVIKASAKEAKARLDDCDADIRKFAGYAERALLDGNEEKARQAILLKQEKEALHPALEQNYAAVKVQADRAEDDYRKLVAGLAKIKARVEAMKNTAKAAKVKNLSEEVHSKTVNAAGGVMDKIDKLEAKANRMLNVAEAKAELRGQGSAADELDALYGEKSDSKVEDELAAMKEKLGLK